MTTTRAVLAAFLVVGLAGRARATQIDYDPATSPNMVGGGSVELTGAGAPATGSTTTTTFVPNYTQVSGTYDLGNDATGSILYSNLAGSGAAFVTYDGDGTNQVQVRMNGQGLASGTPPDPSGGSASGGGEVNFILLLRLDGLTAGQAYTLNYSWSIDATAGYPSFYSGGSSAQGSMLMSTPYGAPVWLFQNEEVDGVAGFEPISIRPSGSGSLSFVANNAPFSTLGIGLFANSSASFGGTTPGTNDQVGSTFYAEATFTLVPEPATAALLAIGGGLLMVVARGRRKMVLGAARCDAHTVR